MNTSPMDLKGDYVWTLTCLFSFQHCSHDGYTWGSLQGCAIRIGPLFDKVWIVCSYFHNECIWFESIYSYLPELHEVFKNQDSSPQTTWSPVGPVFSSYAQGWHNLIWTDDKLYTFQQSRKKSSRLCNIWWDVSIMIPSHYDTSGKVSSSPNSSESCRPMQHAKNFDLRFLWRMLPQLIHESWGIMLRFFPSRHFMILCISFQHGVVYVCDHTGWRHCCIWLHVIHAEGRSWSTCQQDGKWMDWLSVEDKSSYTKSSDEYLMKGEYVWTLTCLFPFQHCSHDGYTWGNLQSCAIWIRPLFDKVWIETLCSHFHNERIR